MGTRHAGNLHAVLPDDTHGRRDGHGGERRKVSGEVMAMKIGFRDSDEQRNSGSIGFCYADRLRIREWYECRWQKMLTRRHCAFDKYKFPWLDRMTPIERFAFDECSANGLVMYPELPVGKRFVDLGNPRLRWAIELDGKQHDAREDQARDKELNKLGWRTFRVPGRDCFHTQHPPYESESRHEWRDFILYGGLNGLVWGLRRLADRAETEWDEEWAEDTVPISSLASRYSAWR